MSNADKFKLDVKDQIKLGQYLVQTLDLNETNADNLSSALADISHSLVKVYSDLLPQLYKTSSRDQAVELLWEIKEEFRHIDYHIKDASLCEMHYVK
jgi:hypothetical protein